ncbi:MAG: IS3 family transposase [Emticicia sp.]
MSQIKVKLTEQVKEVFEEHRKRYGAIRISKELQAQGVKIGRHQVRTLMKKQGLVVFNRKVLYLKRPIQIIVLDVVLIYY